MENKTINSGQIIGVILFIFVLVVAYKYISSGIDDGRRSKAREPLNECISLAERKLEEQVTEVSNTYYETYTPEWKRQCEALKETGRKTDCRPASREGLNKAIQEYKVEAEKTKQDCYKQYK